MKHLRFLPWLLLPLLGAAWGTTPDDLVRQGNAALARKDIAGALRLFDQAEDRTTDPGLVAFNRGVALYQQGDFAQAESYFRLSLSDAQGPRQSAALYNLANCLVQQAGERDGRRLQEAVSLYRRCLRQEDIDDTLADQAAYNLELAVLLWVRANAQSNDEPQRGPSSKDDPAYSQSPEEPPDNEAQSAEGTQRPGRPSRLSPQEKDQKANAASGEHLPGVGNLPVVPDRDDLVPMTSEEAAQHLQQALERVLQEQRAHCRQALRPPPPNALDW